MLANVCVDRFSDLQDQWLVEQPEPNAAGKVAHRGVADLRGDDQLPEHLGDLVGEHRRRYRGIPQPALEKGTDHRQLVALPLVRAEDPVHGLFELATGSKALDTVVAKGSCQIGPESLRQILLVRVEGVQVGVEVLPRAMDPLVRSLLLARLAGCETARKGRRTP